jgi:hypothetical protein
MKILVPIIGLFAVFAIRSFLQDRYETAITAVATGNASNCLMMLGSTTREEDRSTHIVGSIRNNCDRKVGQVTIVFKVAGKVDSKFNQGEAIHYAYVRDLKPGETRAFKTMFSIGKNDTYRFDSITAF